MNARGAEIVRRHNLKRRRWNRRRGRIFAFAESIHPAPSAQRETVDCANGLYTGIATDTGQFRFAATTESTVVGRRRA